MFILGAFISGLEYACDTKAHIVGKPMQAFFMSAIENWGCDPSKVYMIGDVSIKFYILYLFSVFFLKMFLGHCSYYLSLSTICSKT